MFRKFVIATGVLDMLLGLATAVPALLKAEAATFLPMSMIGGFLLFCGAVLVWAAQDVAARGPVIFWQGLLRVFAVIVILGGIRVGLVDAKSALPAALIDIVVGPLYLIGVSRSLSLSPLRLVIGKTA